MRFCEIHDRPLDKAGKCEDCLDERLQDPEVDELNFDDAPDDDYGYASDFDADDLAQ